MPSQSSSTGHAPRSLIYAGIAIVLVFVAAMAAQHFQARSVRSELRASREALELARSEAMIGAAAAESHQGRYEPARQLASRFFTGVQQRTEAASGDQRAALQAILDQRDVTITLLSRGDPAATATLVRLVTQYRTALRGEETR